MIEAKAKTQAKSKKEVHLDLKQQNLCAEQVMDFIEEGNNFLRK